MHVCTHAREATGTNTKTDSGALKRCASAVSAALAITLSLVPHTVHSQRPATLTGGTSGIQKAMIFNAAVPVQNNTVSEPGVKYVWGALGMPPRETANVPSIQGAGNGYYIPWSQDGPATAGDDWFKANHPDWLLYKCDRTTLAQLPGNGPPLDWSNPTVQQYVLSQMLFPALASGYSSIDFDDNPSYNVMNACGHYTAAGAWVTKYQGTYMDQSWATEQASIMAQMRTAILSHYPSASIVVNDGYLPDYTAVHQPYYGLEFPSVDMLMNEGSFLHGGNDVTTQPNYYSSNPWLDEMTYLSHFAQSKGLLMIFQTGYPVTDYMTGTNTQAHRDMLWSLANYLMCRGSHTYFFWAQTAQYSQLPHPQAEEKAVQAIGFATDTFYVSQHVYMRDYSSGLAVVNPSYNTAYTVTFPAGKYKDLRGTAITTRTMAPHSALVLLRT